MSFQYVIDNATSISISKRKRVAQTVSRSGVVKTTSLGGQVYEFSVSLPNGFRYSDNRRFIESVEGLDRTTVDSIKINNPGHAYISQYQGDIPAPSINVTSNGTNTLQINSGVTISSGFVFRAGDFLQLGTSGKVYTVIEDVTPTDTTIKVHRPVLDANTSYTLQVGQDCEWQVICVQLPTFTVFGYDQVQWDGNFVFVEAL